MSARELLLSIVHTDSTFEEVRTPDGAVWVGKCIHCNGKLTVEKDGSASRRVTVEHIVPQSAGGTNDLLNLALACDRCNHQKGRTHDVRGLRDARAAEVVESLLARRRARWRNPEEA